MQRKSNNIGLGEGKKIDIVANRPGLKCHLLKIIYSRGIFPKTNINTTVRQIQRAWRHYDKFYIYKKSVLAKMQRSDWSEPHPPPRTPPLWPLYTRSAILDRRLYIGLCFGRWIVERHLFIIYKCLYNEFRQFFKNFPRFCGKRACVSILGVTDFNYLNINF